MSSCCFCCSSSNHSHTPCKPTEPLFTTPLLPKRLGRRLRRSNAPDKYGFHPWSEYTIAPIDVDTFRTLYTTNTALVDEIGTVSSKPIDLGLRYVFQNPDNGETKVLYIRALK